MREYTRHKGNNESMKNKRVNILGTEYSILFENEKTNTQLEKYDGYLERLAKKIYINKSFFDIKYQNRADVIRDIQKHGEKVIRHEIIHAFIHESGLWENCKWAVDEEMVDWIAMQFPKIQKVFQELGVSE